MRTFLLALLVVTGCRDDKGVGEDTSSGEIGAVDADGDGFTEDEDCDDADSGTNPSASEICDGTDNDCDGTVDEAVTSTFYEDADGDGFGDEDRTTEACSEPDGYVAVGNDCDDDDAESYPSAPERCDEVDNDCDGDIDEEVTSTWHIDADGDGFGDPDRSREDCDPPPEYVADASDCDDLDETSFPGGTEVCDEADNDCDGTVDEDVTTTYYQDADDDNYGVADITTEACQRPTGYAALPGDCDDADDDISPNGVELCDLVDNDCDGTVDEDDAADAPAWHADSDGDGYGDAAVTDVACAAPSGYVADDSDCDDGEADASPGETEVCDEIDNDCDGEADEDSAADAATWYADNDGDGYGGTSSTVACDQPSGFSAVSTDCDDGEADANPGETEVCDEIDNDCDGDTDEGVTTTFYADSDGDGFGDVDRTTDACEAPSGYVSDDTDCDDRDDDNSPDGEEVCDGDDNDCDGDIDDGVLGTGEACPAESCAEVLDEDSAATDGSYYLDVDGSGAVEQYTCDMTTDGGGWTQVVAWDRVSDGDGWAELDAEMDTVYDNMTRQLEATTYIYWADWNSDADLLAYKRDVPFANDGEIIVDIYYYGYSMDNSATFVYAETATADEDILCKEDDDGGYSTTEYSYWPYTCSSSADTSWTWSSAYQAAFSDEIEAFHFRSFMYDGSGGDYSYLYRLNVYVR